MYQTALKQIYKDIAEDINYRTVHLLIKGISLDNIRIEIVKTKYGYPQYTSIESKYTNYTHLKKYNS